jgi:hypothetical protein
MAKAQEEIKRMRGCYRFRQASITLSQEVQPPLLCMASSVFSLISPTGESAVRNYMFLLRQPGCSTRCEESHKVFDYDAFVC